MNEWPVAGTHSGMCVTIIIIIILVNSCYIYIYIEDRFIKRGMLFLYKRNSFHKFKNPFIINNNIVIKNRVLLSTSCYSKNSIMTSNLNTRPSLASIDGTRGLSRRDRPCDDCTCSPGLVSRRSRRSNLLSKQLENIRRMSSRDTSLSNTTNGGNENSSIYSSDTLFCANNKEVNTTKRLLALRKEMIKYDLCCYIVPSEDEHLSEYVSESDQRRSFISGFSGSAGIACITRDLTNFNLNDPSGKSILSTDGRYFNQASHELDFNWSLLKQGEDLLTWEDWCINEAIEMSKTINKQVNIGIDPKLISYLKVKEFNKKISNNNLVKLIPIEENLIDKIWGNFEKIPKRELNLIYKLDDKFTGKTFKEKRIELINNLKKKYNNSNNFIVVALDEIAWLLNLRGSDIDYNPVFFSYLFINDNKTILFIDNDFKDNKIKEELINDGIEIKKYNEFWEYLNNNIEINDKNNELLLLPDQVSWEIIRKIESKPYKLIHSNIDILKSIKNEIEIKNARKAQVKDAISIIQYFAWLEDRLINHESLINEYKASEKLTSIRKTQKNFINESFETISSTGSNSAIIHYSPPNIGSTIINPSNIYLCDTGSQFLEGTTDITRTIHFTEPKQEEINNYTLVLKGNLSIERLKFPKGTNGYQIDIIARQYLWENGLDYKHGTGHGIGSTLNVHEGPIGIGPRLHLIPYEFQAGNIISNEPGYYKDDHYGIRIENDILVKDSQEYKNFLEFENLTLVPYCRKLINVKMLTDTEREQVNKQHKKIHDTLIQLLQPQSIASKWLKRETAPL